MSIFRDILETARSEELSLECYDRRGELGRSMTGAELVEAIRRYRTAFTGWSSESFGGHKVVGLFFRSDETIDFLIATFAAIAEGFTVVPFYPNWSAEVQRAYLVRYGVRAVAVGEGFRERVAGWTDDVDRVVTVSAAELPPALSGNKSAFPDRESGGGEGTERPPAAWIFTSGTSGDVPKCTVISEDNIAAAVEGIRELDFIRAGMTLHSPLSTSHIFAFVVVLGILAVRPRRIIFSDVQYLSRLDQARIGKIDGLILVPIVLNRLRSGFYDALLRPDAGAASTLTRIPPTLRSFLKRCVQTAERAVAEMEGGRARGFLAWPAVALSRLLFGREIRRRLGSPDFVVVGGAKPSLLSMAFLDVMGTRCLQGWGMTETTGPLAVCRLRDRFRGAFGTCGDLFPGAAARVDGEELVVEGPQIACGYLHPDGTFEPFHGSRRTGDCGEFDSRGRLKVNGKASDRITLTNGLNYNPLLLEDAIASLDLDGGHVLDECVVIGEGQPRLGCVFFVRESAGRDVEDYLARIVRELNAQRPIDEQIGPWVVHPGPFLDSGFVGPSGKLRRHLVERRYSHLYEPATLDRAAS